MTTFCPDDAQVAQYREDGYLMVPGLFSQTEVDTLLNVARRDQLIANAGGMADGAGGVSRIWIRGKLEEDIYSAFVHCERVAGTMQRLMGAPIVHLHHKMMLKEPRVGGAWEWHQDYGYWYNDGFLFPDMASCMIAADRATRDNGCLQVLKGSHRLGRIEHGRVGAQTGALPERVSEAAKVLEHVYCEMEPGTALFFHSNLLHCSAANTSEQSRWSLICCYTAASNRSFVPRFHDDSPTLEVWPDTKVLEVGKAHLAAIT